MSTTIFSLFDQPSHVQAALMSLTELGVPPKDITVSSRDPETQLIINPPESDTASGAMIGTGVAAGSAATAVIATVAAAAVAPIGAPLFVLFVLGGGMLGALYGSVAGAIVETGYSLEHEQEIEKSLVEGKILVAVKVDPTLREAVHAALERAGGMAPAVPFSHPGH